MTQRSPSQQKSLEQLAYILWIIEFSIIGICLLIAVYVHSFLFGLIFAAATGFSVCRIGAISLRFQRDSQTRLVTETSQKLNATTLLAARTRVLLEASEKQRSDLQVRLDSARAELEQINRIRASRELTAFLDRWQPSSGSKTS